MWVLSSFPESHPQPFTLTSSLPSTVSSPHLECDPSGGPVNFYSSLLPLTWVLFCGFCLTLSLCRVEDSCWEFTLVLAPNSPVLCLWGVLPSCGSSGSPYTWPAGCKLVHFQQLFLRSSASLQWPPGSFSQPVCWFSIPSSALLAQ